MAEALVIGRDGYEHALAELAAMRSPWAQTSAPERADLLDEIRHALMPVAAEWVDTASRIKGLPPRSPLEGEEWLSGPYALLSACDAYADTLRKMPGKAFLNGLHRRVLPGGQLAVRVLPRTLWDRILYSGVTAEVWMQPGVRRETLAAHAAPSWDIPPAGAAGRGCVGAGGGQHHLDRAARLPAQAVGRASGGGAEAEPGAGGAGADAGRGVGAADPARRAADPAG